MYLHIIIVEGIMASGCAALVHLRSTAVSHVDLVLTVALRTEVMLLIHWHDAYTDPRPLSSTQVLSDSALLFEAEGVVCQSKTFPSSSLTCRLQSQSYAQAACLLPLRVRPLDALSRDRSKSA